MKKKKRNIKRTAIVWTMLTGCALATPLAAKTADSTYVMPQHSVFVEIGGVTGLIGLNYDMRLKKNSPWGFRTGVSYAFDSEELITYTDTKEHLWGFSTELNYLLGGRRNHLELGLGNKLWVIKYDQRGAYYNDPSSYFIYRHTWARDMIYLNIGYRHEALHGFQFRCGVTPMIHVTNDWLWADGSTCHKGDILFAPYVSFGWAF